MSDESVDAIPAEFPLEILVEIFSYKKNRYTEFRCLCKKTYRAKISWDEWDSLIEQGMTIAITSQKIVWKKLSPAYFSPFGVSWPPRALPHRSGDLPAVEWIDGKKEWWVKGVLHRQDGLPAVTYSDGIKHWYENGKLIKYISTHGQIFISF